MISFFGLASIGENGKITGIMQNKFDQGASPWEWLRPPTGNMRAPAVLFATRALLDSLDARVIEQLENIATLPGIVNAAYAMPDAHQGYGFPIGGVAAFDPAQGGIISAGGVGFDIACGVRTLLTGIPAADIQARRENLADALAAAVPAGVASRGAIRLNPAEMEAMLTRGAAWAVRQGYGTAADLPRIESGGIIAEADPDKVSPQARWRQQDEMGTLGSGNHYLEVQRVAEIYDREIAAAFGLREQMAVVSIHCGSRGLGHQVATDYAERMGLAAARHGLRLPDRELACAPIDSPEGRDYLGAMRAAANCALANRQIITALVRGVFQRLFNLSNLPLLFDVSHNFCQVEEHPAGKTRRKLYVHRKGATCARAPGHPDLPPEFQSAGQPVLVGGSMGSSSYVLAGAPGNAARAFASACHGAGRRMSRSQARKQWRGPEIVRQLARQGIATRGQSNAGMAEEAPGAYKNIEAVIAATVSAGLARRVARLEPLLCVKG